MPYFDTSTIIYDDYKDYNIGKGYLHLDKQFSDRKQRFALGREADDNSYLLNTNPLPLIKQRFIKYIYDYINCNLGE